ncbi:MAG: putative GTP cyclohydrolase 1 type 2 [candidate division BRC1 bacterium ADurb.BinA364]|nr:MAG: putative GTP cyclohydrolase 1 type 2 [candidate division BRC1 bacterium ADurb.BinA364]
MPFTLGDLAGLVERIAPAQLAEEWDNAGLQAGDPAAPAPRVLIGLEPEQSLIEEALERGARAIVTHHPLIFRPLRAVRADDRVGRIVLRLAREGLGLVVAHTNLDKSPAGPNAALADCLGLERRRWLKPHTESGGCKLVVFTPKGHEAAVIAALAEGGAGVIGKYTHCTFRAEGIGTYLPQEGARPYAGRPGRFEEAEEWRLEAVCPRERLPRVLELVLRQERRLMIVQIF